MSRSLGFPRQLAGFGFLTALLVGGCTAERAPAPEVSNAESPSAMAPTTTPTRSNTPTVEATSAPSTTPARAFDPAAARATIEQLAALGPREATGPAYARAAEQVGAVFERYGYRATRRQFEVPAGNSWGIAVPAGSSVNVIADPQGFQPERPHVVIGAHLDTVPQAPGAEDNASGVAVMLELARMLAEEPAGLPVRFIAFGAEEPRGPGDARHHYGSRHYVAALDEPGRSAIKAMVSLDRVGVPSDAVPIAHGGRGTDRIARQLADAAPDAVRVRLGTNTTSDHWSFDKAGIPAARLGSVPYAGYHSPTDTPAVIDDDQLDRVGAVMWAWLREIPEA